MQRFQLVSNYVPAGDQPKAIEALVRGLDRGLGNQTLLGVTGSGKTFTIANVIAKTQRPTLVIAHNKTLAAQLANEFRELFPKNSVQYFVSYYDYYQPEAYLPVSDTYIDKEAMINEEIDKLRHAATTAVLTRRDVIVVASVSCIYGLGEPETYAKYILHFHEGSKLDRDELMKKLVFLQYSRTTSALTRGTFRVRGEHWEVMPVDREVIYEFDVKDGRVKEIYEIDPVTGFVPGITPRIENAIIGPAKHFITETPERERAITAIREELKRRLADFEKDKKYLEAERLERRTHFDLAMMKEVGYCHGIENYSRHLSGRTPGSPPATLLDYFRMNHPDFLTVIDESHVTVPQIGGMYEGDAARKKTLIEYGFRLPSAQDNRPLKFDEFTDRVGQIIYTSATPGAYERKKSCPESNPSIGSTLRQDSGQAGTSAMSSVPNGSPRVDSTPQQSSGQAGTSAMSSVPNGSPRASSGLNNCRGIVQQVIRPTGLVDPKLTIRPARGQVHDLLPRIQERTDRKERVLITTLTKRMAEDLSGYLKEANIKSCYLHSDVKTLDRIRILTELRKGTFDVLVGVNLLREGLDLPEVSLVAILDADKEGFLRSETSLIQTIGRAARNVSGEVMLYADQMTGSLERAVRETERRRKLQIAYNKKHGITPTTIEKAIKNILPEEVLALELAPIPRTRKAIENLIAQKEREMREAANELNFELAALLRDEVGVLSQKKKKIKT